jgi:CheY-like chemotaxis protein
VAERPLILLLENRPDARETMRALFEAIDCSVIPVATYESAFAEISSRDDIDFVVTDINLKEDENDKSGVIFAKMARKLREDIPVAAYSAKVKELALSPNDYRVFDLFLDKNSERAEDTMHFVTDCKALALAHKQMSTKLPRYVTAPADIKFQELENRLKRIELTYLKRPNLVPYARISYAILGLLGAIASIVGLYLILK